MHWSLILLGGIVVGAGAVLLWLDWFVRRKPKSGKRINPLTYWPSGKKDRHSPKCDCRECWGDGSF